MSLFGWSLPPGCGTLPGEEDDEPCEVCGHAIDDCICPVCLHCGVQGNPECYDRHFLKRTPQQIAGRAGLDKWYAGQVERDKAEAAYWASPDRLQERADIDYWTEENKR